MRTWKRQSADRIGKRQAAAKDSNLGPGIVESDSHILMMVYEVPTNGTRVSEHGRHHATNKTATVRVSFEVTDRAKGQCKLTPIASLQTSCEQPAKERSGRLPLRRWPAESSNKRHAAFILEALCSSFSEKRHTALQKRLPALIQEVACSIRHRSGVPQTTIQSDASRILRAACSSHRYSGMPHFLRKRHAALDIEATFHFYVWKLTLDV